MEEWIQGVTARMPAQEETREGKRIREERREENKLQRRECNTGWGQRAGLSVCKSRVLCKQTAPCEETWKEMFGVVGERELRPSLKWLPVPMALV
eukprot:755248-Hanusia_phi.AAC.4